MLYEDILRLNWNHNQTLIIYQNSNQIITTGPDKKDPPWLSGDSIYSSGEIILQFKWIAFGNHNRFSLDLPLEYGYRHLQNITVDFEDGECADDAFVDETVLELLTHYIEWQPIVENHISAIWKE